MTPARDKTTVRATSVIIRPRGEDISTPAVDAGTYTLFRSGRFPRIAKLFDEELVEARNFPTVEAALALLQSSDLPADLLTIANPFHNASPRLPYQSLADNVAVVSTGSYDDWWNGLPQESRKNMRLAGKRGVSVNAANFDDELISGIKKIYDETPVRQGRTFWHYQKPLERVRELNATYPDRSHFIGAYFEGELIGFIKYISVDKVAVLIQILAMELHRDKKTVNALLRQAVESCHTQGFESLVYGKFDYGVNQDSSLKEFKRRNGFRELTFERYYIPVSRLGEVAIAIGIHRGWQSLLPSGLRGALHRVRGRLAKVLKPAVRLR
jgi:hypothetical protein